MTAVALPHDQILVARGRRPEGTQEPVLIVEPLMRKFPLVSAPMRVMASRQTVKGTAIPRVMRLFIQDSLRV